MKISDIKVFPTWVGGRNQLIVKVETDDGYYGWGESGLSGRELAVAEAVNAVVPDMAVSLSDVGEGAVLPAWVTEHAAKGAGVAIDQETVDWIKNSSTLYCAWHWCKRGVGGQVLLLFVRIQICLGVDLISF